MTNPPPVHTDDTHPEIHAALSEWYQRWGEYALSLAAYNAAKAANPTAEVDIPQPPEGLAASPIVSADPLRAKR